MELIRSFISVDLPENIQREIKKLQDQLPGFEGKRTELENLHLTLKFLGDVGENDIEEVKKRLREIKFSEFECEVDELGVFDNRRSRKRSRKIIVWLHLSNCEELQRVVDEKLEGLFGKEERFMGHVTIARVKYLKNKNYFLGELGKIKVPALKFKVDNFRLKKSELREIGPIYETLEEFKAG
jgi:2'-5' RNA ligase